MTTRRRSPLAPRFNNVLLGRLLGGTSLVLLGLVLMRIIVGHQPEFGDVYAYHRAWDNLYQTDAGDPHAFVYTPAAAQALWPYTFLPFPLFYLLLLAGNTAALLYTSGWRLAGWFAALFYPVSLELAVGNIHLMLVAAFMLSLRHPAWWAFAFLTKITPGVGLLYEWRRPRRMLTALVVTGVIWAASIATVPHLWSDWLAMLLRSSVGSDPLAFVHIPLVVRLPFAAGIAIVAGWRRWPWLVPIAMIIALPIVWLGSLSMLVAALPHRYAGASDE